jgi:hypothetical protein
MTQAEHWERIYPTKEPTKVRVPARAATLARPYSPQPSYWHRGSTRRPSISGIGVMTGSCQEPVVLFTSFVTRVDVHDNARNE